MRPDLPFEGDFAVVTTEDRCLLRYFMPYLQQLDPGSASLSHSYLRHQPSPFTFIAFLRRAPRTSFH